MTTCDHCGSDRISRSSFGPDYCLDCGHSDDEHEAECTFTYDEI